MKLTIKFLLVLSFIFCSTKAFTNTFYNLPEDILSRAVSSDIPFDEDFDYVRIGGQTKLFSSISQHYQKNVQKNLVDQVVVYKAAHQMLLLKGGVEIKRFWIALSDRPIGHKQFEGDKKTPEGTYILDYIKEKSNYYKAMHISYPNSQDIENARKLGKRPGGMIMIHGQPPSKSEYHETVQRTNWTNGCIALLNPDLDLFLSLVDVGTPITINP